MPEDQFVRLNADRLFVLELHRGDSTLRARAVDSIYRAHGSDSSAVAATLAWYADHPERLAVMFDSTVALLERRAAGSRSKEAGTP
jgi:hypothetical protein